MASAPDSPRQFLFGWLAYLRHWLESSTHPVGRWILRTRLRTELGWRSGSTLRPWDNPLVRFLVGVFLTSRWVERRRVQIWWKIARITAEPDDDEWGEYVPPPREVQAVLCEMLCDLARVYEVDGVGHVHLGAGLPVTGFDVCLRNDAEGLRVCLDLAFGRLPAR